MCYKYDNIQTKITLQLLITTQKTTGVTPELGTIFN